MDPRVLGALLAVLRDAGVSSARVPVQMANEALTMEVTFGPRAGTDAPAGPEQPADEDLPPGAYDPIAARKRAL
jgi:hypothetical protein